MIWTVSMVFVRRPQMYFLVNGIKTEMKLPTSIAVIGDATYELPANLRRWASEEKEREAAERRKCGYTHSAGALEQRGQPVHAAKRYRPRFRRRCRENISMPRVRGRGQHSYDTCHFRSYVCRATPSPGVPAALLAR
ncbi:unnamed protein product [Arctia plantaginis]|uniref:Uncharacterized protein n=1 Tax=Arctia plantaginis TaxID=874455 RepID=A0A8S1AXU6_ARCPL|nr:unnamed protein product [Arctia plantaginis]CAB3251446.1 unnamed protein product [Arctia plantaginis]